MAKAKPKRRRTRTSFRRGQVPNLLGAPPKGQAISDYLRWMRDEEFQIVLRDKSWKWLRALLPRVHKLTVTGGQLYALHELWQAVVQGNAYAKARIADRIDGPLERALEGGIRSFTLAFIGSPEHRRLVEMQGDQGRFLPPAGESDGPS